MELDFKVDKNNSAWRSVNDNVMGGKSLGGLKFKNKRMIFEGQINTNGGGFSSIRLPIEPGLLEDATNLIFRIKSDGRGYKTVLRSDALYRGRQIAFQGDISNTTKDNWTNVSVSFDSLQGSVFGRRVENAIFNKGKVNSLGIILADGVDGPFKLEVEWIKACNNDRFEKN
jgi:hypothetical protein